MKFGYNTTQDQPIANAADDTSDAFLCARTLAQPVCAAADNQTVNRGRGMMNTRRSSRGRWCSTAVLIAFAAMLAVCIMPAVATSPAQADQNPVTIDYTAVNSTQTNTMMLNNSSPDADLVNAGDGLTGTEIKQSIPDFVAASEESVTADEIVSFANGEVLGAGASETSFGTEHVFNSAITNYISVSALDATHFVVAYQDAGNSNYGTAIIGTVSSNTITYGSEKVFNSAFTSPISVSALDATNFVVAYRDHGNSSHGTAIIGTVSGNTITYGSEKVFNSASTSSTSVSAPDATNFVVAYRDHGNSSHGTAIIGAPAQEPTYNCICGDICVNTSGWWRRGGAFNANATTPIQAAVDNATAGETIYVWNGSYTENVNVNEQVTLVGAGADAVTVTAALASDHVFEVTADYVNISGFNVTGAANADYAGIYLYSAEHCYISDNNVSGNDYAIYLKNTGGPSEMHSGSYAWYSHDDYGNQDTTLNRMFDLTGVTRANLTFWHWYHTESGCDGGRVEVNNGSGWTPITPEGGYPGSGYWSDDYSGQSNGWKQATFNLTEYAGQSINLRFRYAGDGSVNYIGWYIDDISISEIGFFDDVESGIGDWIASSTQGSTWSISTSVGSSRYNMLMGNTASNNHRGIRLHSSSNNILLNNTASDNDYDGIGLYDSSDDNMLSGNTASDDNYGIALEDSSNNILLNNTASDNDYDGIGLYDSSDDNMLSGNTASDNNYGIALEDSSNNTLTGNTAPGNNYGIWLYSSSDNTLTSNNASNNDHDGIALEDSSNNTLTGNTAPGNNYGIWLYSSSDNTLTSNNASNNDYDGIVLEDSSNNTLTGNTASDNSDWDLHIEGSPSNTFADNTLNGTTVSFTYSGDITLKGEGSPAADPTGWHNIGKFINATNLTADTWLYLNFSYPGCDLDDLVEASLTVWEHDGTWWVKDGWDNGRYLDTTGDVVGANITSFSIFAPMGVLPLHYINVTPGLPQTLGINESQDFAATGYDRGGANVSGYFAFEWDISDEYIGRFTEINDTATNFTADHVGITYITASNGTVASDRVQVTVDAAKTTNETVTNGTAIATSGDANVTCYFGENVTGWINITAIGNTTNSSEVNPSNPRYGLGSGDMVVSGVTVNVSKGILDELAAGNGMIRIEICYNETTLTALGIDASTLAIWKYDNDTEKWMKQSSTISGRCVYADVKHLCTFGLVGSNATGGDSTGGGGGAYPPGWYGTPTPTVTATKAPAAPATGTATAAPPGERVTPATTRRPAAAKMTVPAAAETAKKGAPGFTAVFVIAGMLAVAYAMMRRRE